MNLLDARPLITQDRNMEIMVKDLVTKYSWEEIEPILSKLYPSPKRSIAEYKEAYQKFAEIVPTQTSMRIVIEESDDSTFGKWHDVYGKNGMLVKEVFQTELARQRLQNRWEDEQEYALSYTAWAEIAGMVIDSLTLLAYDEKDIVVHVLGLITEKWHSNEQNLKVLKEMEAIAKGGKQNLVLKEMVGKNGFRQTWSEKENGEYHGLYTVYWANDFIEQQGIIIDGNKEGIWTYWDESGKIKSQVRYSCDREMELKTKSPWWDNVKNQKHT